MSEAFKFKLVGFFACLFSGKLGMYNFLKSQARLETGRWTSRRFLEGKNGFGMHYPAPGAIGAFTGDDGGEGGVAIFPSYWACWRSRLGWDERHNVRNYSSLTEYAAMLEIANYSSSGTYAEALLAQYDDDYNMLETCLDVPVENPSGSMWRKYLWWILVPVVFILLYYFVKWAKRKLKARYKGAKARWK